MRDKDTADLMIKRLLKTKEQIDASIEILNSHHINGYVAISPTGILCVSPYKEDEDYSLIVFGRGNFLICQKALIDAQAGPKT